MLHLLDADTLITGDRTFYPMKRFPVFWNWLLFHGTTGNIKIPQEQYDEITAGKGELVERLREKEKLDSLLLPGAVDAALLTRVTQQGYATDLDEDEVIAVGQDPFLVAYALVSPSDRMVASFENSAPSKTRANRKVPDVCATFGIKCINLFGLIEVLDFTTDWVAP
jgi:hypothetical protein